MRVPRYDQEARGFFVDKKSCSVVDRGVSDVALFIFILLYMNRVLGYRLHHGQVYIHIGFISSLSTFTHTLVNKYSRLRKIIWKKIGIWLEANKKATTLIKKRRTPSDHNYEKFKTQNLALRVVNSKEAVRHSLLFSAPSHLKASFRLIKLD